MGVIFLLFNDLRDFFGYEIMVFIGFDSYVGIIVDVFIVLMGRLE